MRKIAEWLYVTLPKYSGHILFPQSRPEDSDRRDIAPDGNWLTGPKAGDAFRFETPLGTVNPMDRKIFGNYSAKSPLVEGVTGELLVFDDEDGAENTVTLGPLDMAIVIRADRLAEGVKLPENMTEYDKMLAEVMKQPGIGPAKGRAVLAALGLVSEDDSAQDTIAALKAQLEALGDVQKDATA